MCSFCLYACFSMYVCMYVCMHACMYVCMYVRMYVGRMLVCLLRQAMNRGVFGLTGGVYSADRARAARILADLRVGTTYWNCCGTHNYH